MKIVALPYVKNPHDYFNHLADLPHAVLLDGGHPWNQDQRFNIMSSNPYFVIDTSITSDTLFLTIQKQIRALQSKASIPAQLNHLPFTIGAIGYLSYDIGNQAMLDCPIKKRKQLPDVIVCFYDFSIVIDHQEKKAWLIALSESRISFISQQLTKVYDYTHFKVSVPFQSSMTFQQYTQGFRTIQDHIKHGDCYQINFSQQFHAQYEGSPWCAYQKLRQAHPAPYSAYLRLNDQQAILSCSPECFLTVHNGEITTQPIKGSAPRFQDPGLDEQSKNTLLSSEKDRTENIMIVDLLRNDLSQCCKPGSVHVPELIALKTFSNVHHLVSTVIGALKADQSPIDLLQRCFPGGSITGVPKKRAMEIIDMLEPHARSIYCGSIFHLGINDHLNANIAIRTFVCDKNDIYCYGGGAIVADSVLHQEYQESLFKVDKLFATLTDAE